MVQQSISNPLGINVFGSALMRVEPDIASLSFGVSSVEKKADAAFQATRSLARNVQLYLKQAGIDEVSTSRIHLHTRYEFVQGRQEFVGYTATLMFTVLLNDLNRIEEILVGVVDAGANVIESTTFESSQLKEFRAEARRRAVEAAREKAENYCSAAGVSLGDVLHIEDVNPDSLRGSGEGHTTSEFLADDTGEPRAISAGSIAVRGAVMIAYSLKENL